MVEGGASFAPSCAAVSLGQRTCPKKKVVCVLGMGFGHVARASELRLRPVRARVSTFRGRVLTLPLNGRKNTGYTSKRPFALFFSLTAQTPKPPALTVLYPTRATIQDVTPKILLILSYSCTIQVVILTLPTPTPPPRRVLFLCVLLPKQNLKVGRCDKLYRHKAERSPQRRRHPLGREESYSTAPFPHHCLRE